MPRASALYPMAYYLGSSLGGSLIGFAWSNGSWPLTASVVATLFVLAGVVALGVQAETRAGTQADSAASEGVQPSTGTSTT